jgi:hypothetical protein
MATLENLSLIYFRTATVSLTTPYTVLVGLGDRLGPENDPKLPKISSSQRVNFTFVFKVSKLPSLLRNSGNFVKVLKHV